MIDSHNRSSSIFVGVSDLREEFKASPVDAGVSVGETAVLECEPPPGQPKPHVLWLKEGQTVGYFKYKKTIHYFL